jgi:N-acetyl-gamma-glutamyl-phosphate reductase
MIKVGVSGCDTLRAQELLRVLVNHPDVELKWVSGRAQPGVRVDTIVLGLIGESDLTVVADEPLGDVDLVFLCDGRAEVMGRLSSANQPDDLHVIDLSGSHNLDHGLEKKWRYGLSEMQRRYLVHDSPLVTLPGSAAAASLLALVPMARNQMINSPLTLRVTVGSSALPCDGKTADGMMLDEWESDQRNEVEYALQQCQPGFNQPIDMDITPVGEPRVLTVTAQLKCGVPVEALRELYEQYYDDHNFVFVVSQPVTMADVENTNKCLITLDKDELTGVVTIHAVMDVLLKGAAGAAVHVMNLMYGLHERVGLALKGTGC